MYITGETNSVIIELQLLDERKQNFLIRNKENAIVGAKRCPRSGCKTYLLVNIISSIACFKSFLVSILDEKPITQGMVTFV